MESAYGIWFAHWLASVCVLYINSYTDVWGLMSHLRHINNLGVCAQGLLGKAEVVLKAHLTLQLHRMIYSVNGFNPGTHTCADIHSGRVKQLDGFFRSTMQTHKLQKNKKKQNSWFVWHCCSLARNTQTDQQSVMFCHSSVYPHTRRNTCKHTRTWAHARTHDCKSHSNTQTDKPSRCLNWTD